MKLTGWVILIVACFQADERNWPLAFFLLTMSFGAIAYGEWKSR